MTWNSFEIDTDGKKICFMISVHDSLFIGAANDDGIVESIHELKRDKKTKEFKLKGGKIWHRRAKSPLFERIVLQFKDIINFLGLSKEEQEKAISILVDIALDISKAEEVFLEYVDVEDAVVLKYQHPKGIAPQENALIYENPSIILKAKAENIIIRLIIAYRKLPKIVSIIRGEAFGPGRSLVNKLAELVPSDSPDRKSFEYDNHWIKELYDIRNEIEHERWEMHPFEVTPIDHDDRFDIERCRVSIKSQGKKPIALVEYLNVTLYNLVTFIEEMVALAAVDRIRYPCRLVSLPEAERPKRNYYKYVVDLVPEVKEKLPTS